MANHSAEGTHPPSETTFHQFSDKFRCPLAKAAGATDGGGAPVLPRSLSAGNLLRIDPHKPHRTDPQETSYYNRLFHLWPAVARQRRRVQVS